MTDPTSRRADRSPFDVPPSGPTPAAVLTPEVVAAFIEGTLPPTQRAEVAAVIDADPEVYDWLVQSLELARELPDVTAGALYGTGAPGVDSLGRRLPDLARRRQPGRWWLAAAGLAAAAALVFAVRSPVFSTRVVRPPHEVLSALVAAAGTPAFEGWISGGFPAGAGQVMRGGEVSASSATVLALAAELERADANQPSPTRAHALGVALLLVGGAERDQATARLEAAVAGDPQPVYLSDLAAAYLERAIRTGRSADADQALKHAAQAVAIAPTMPEALYNRALALHTLNRSLEAAAAWNAVIGATSNPSALAAARRYQAQLPLREP